MMWRIAMASLSSDKHTLLEWIPIQRDKRPVFYVAQARLVDEMENCLSIES